MPNWGGDMSEIYFDDIYYYIKPTKGQVDEWDELPDAIKQTYEKLGIPEAERKYLAGVTAQYESEVVFHRNREDLERQGVIFCDMDTALREYPELVKQYFGTIIPPTTTSSRRSTPPCGRVARSSTCRPASRSRCRCRPTSASTPRTWASSSGR
jgi:Fe-S cluster assembly scaffold protein SufB